MQAFWDFIDLFREWSLGIFAAIPLGEWLQDVTDVAVDWLVINASWVLDMFLLAPIDLVLSNFKDLLDWIPWPIVVVLVYLIGWRNAGWKIGRPWHHCHNHLCHSTNGAPHQSGDSPSAYRSCRSRSCLWLQRPPTSV